MNKEKLELLYRTIVTEIEKINDNEAIINNNHYFGLDSQLLTYIRFLEKENKQLKEQIESSNLIKYLTNIAKLISSGEIPKEVYNKYLGNVPCGFMNEKDLIKWFLEKSDNQ